VRGSSQSDPNIAVPHGHYTDESMKQTVVPNRNMLMLSVAVAWAISVKADSVCYGAHAGDRAIYPDCREEFASAFNTAALLADWHQVSLSRPFVDMSKAEIVTLGRTLEVPFGQTWSCYEGGEKHCGLCGTCVERAEAFREAAVEDPTEYESPPCY
jgi:7-cyano-7-deazaguanine synthase